MRKPEKVALLFLLFILSFSFLTFLFFSPLARAQENTVGDKVCQECHDDIYQRYAPTVHKQPAGCESCHGPGAAHVKEEGDVSRIFSYTVASAQQASGVCLKCHRQQAKQNDYRRSSHGTSGLACNVCHQPHATPIPKLLKKEQMSLCYDCHKEIQVDFSLPERHRVPESQLQCTDCHNPHARLKRVLLSSQNREKLCSQCHRDKTGPFIYEHSASFFEGCTACHVPHGSINRHMLNQQDVKLLCLSCHSGTIDLGNVGFGFHGTVPGYNQSCTNCHAAIHGSNSSSKFLR